MIPISIPLLGDEEKQAILEVIDSGQLAQGARVAAFGNDRIADGDPCARHRPW